MFQPLVPGRSTHFFARQEQATVDSDQAESLPSQQPEWFSSAAMMAFFVLLLVGAAVDLGQWLYVMLPSSR